MDCSDLKNKKVLITGSGTGIGQDFTTWCPVRPVCLLRQLMFNRFMARQEIFRLLVSSIFWRRIWIMISVLLSRILRSWPDHGFKPGLICPAI